VDSGTIGEGQWRCKFKRIQSETTVRRHMGRTFLWLATVKILGDADSRRPCARQHRVVNGDHLQGMMVWIQEDTERDYSQREYGKNVVVVGDADSRRRCARVNGDDLQGTMEDTERDYSQTEYRKNVLVFGDSGNGENSLAMRRITMCEGRSSAFEGGG
jgi:hypothetical protein